MTRSPKIKAALLLAAVVCGCPRTEAPPQREAAEPSLLVSVARVTREPIRSMASFPGTTVALKQLTVRAPASGIVSDLNLQPGDTVTRAKTIARVITREDVAARTGMKIAHELGSGDEKAMATAIERFASGPGIAVVAAENAIVSKRDATNGQFVNEFDPIVELIDPGSIYVEAAAPLRLMLVIHPGMAAVVSSPALPAPAAAHVAAILPGASPASQTFQMRITFDGQRVPIAQAGVAVDVSIATASRPDALIIPAAALFVNPQDGSNYLFVVGPDNRAHRVAVVAGVRSGERVEVTRGLSENDRVITSGGYALSDGLPVRVAER